MDGEMEMEKWIRAEGWWNLLCCVMIDKAPEENR